MEQDEVTPNSADGSIENGKVDSPGLHDDSQHLQCVHSPGPECKGIVAVIPAYNEEQGIGNVVLAASHYVETVIVIDDGSRDYTAVMAKTAGATVVALAKNSGKGSALRQGLARALLQENLRAIVLLDADGQHDADELPAVVQPILDAQADLVIGSRFLDVHSEIPWWRQVGQHGLTWLTNLASGTNMTDSQSGFRALSPAVAWLFLQVRSNGFSVESEMQFTIREHNLKTVEVPISCAYKKQSKRNPFTHGLQVLDGIVRLAIKMRPLLFFGVPSVLLLLLSMVMAFVVVQVYAQTQILAIGHAIVGVVSTIIGANGLSLGVILHVMRSLLQSSQKEPTNSSQNDQEK